MHINYIICRLYFLLVYLLLLPFKNRYSYCFVPWKSHLIVTCLNALRAHVLLVKQLGRFVLSLVNGNADVMERIISICGPDKLRCIGAPPMLGVY